MNSVSLQPGLCRAVHPVYGYGDAGRRMRMPQAARPCPHGFKYHGFLLCAETGIPCQGLRMWGYHAGFPGQAVQGLYIHQKALFLSGAVPMLLKKSAAIQHLYSGYRNPGGFLSGGWTVRETMNRSSTSQAAPWWNRISVYDRQ